MIVCLKCEAKILIMLLHYYTDLRSHSKWFRCLYSVVYNNVHTSLCSNNLFFCTTVSFFSMSVFITI